MKKFILMALVTVAAATYQPAKAQVSLNVNIGAQPRYGYYSDYYAPPVVRRTYYAPTSRYVYVDRNKYSNQRSYASNRVYRSSYARPTNRYYTVKQGNIKIPINTKIMAEATVKEDTNFKNPSNEKILSVRHICTDLFIQQRFTCAN